MNKKILISLLIFCLGITLIIGVVNAEDLEVSDRDIAIADIMVGGTLTAGKTIKENYGEGESWIYNYADNHELDDWMVVDFSNNQLANLGMTALVLENQGNVIISFRGTDTEWIEDGVINGLLNFHPQELPANIYVKKIVKNYGEKEGNYKIYVTGMSLGGYIAQTAGATIANEVEKYDNVELEKIMNFDGIGINFLTFFGDFGWGAHTNTIETLKRLGEEGKLVDYYVYGDVISAAGLHYGEMRCVYPSIDSIERQRTKYSVLNTAQSIVPISTALAILMENTFNAFKTDINNARKLYDVNSAIAFLSLTHTSIEFVALNHEESEKDVVLQISKKDGINKYTNLEGNSMTLNGSATLKVTTLNASAKKYVWKVSTDKKNWETVKTVDLYNPDGTTPTNTIDIENTTGKTIYYKVESYYDSNYISTRLYRNKLGQYDYQETNESKQEEADMKEVIIEIKGNSNLSATSTTSTTILSKVKLLDTLKSKLKAKGLSAALTKLRASLKK